MDTLKDVLLVFTVVLLVYVLYRRLLNVLGKKEKSTRYVEVSETMEWEGRSLKMTVESLRPMELQMADRQLEKGTHAIELDCASLTKGRYYVWLKTSAQEYSRYFEITE